MPDSGAAAGGPWWVHLPTVSQTCVRLTLAPLRDGDPWPLARALTALGRLGAVPTGTARGVGRGRGLPLITSRELRWRGVALEAEATHAAGEVGEASLGLPPWDELAAGDGGEDGVWELIDAFACAVDGLHGAIGDGEALAPQLASAGSLTAIDAAATRRHLGLLLPASAPLPAAAGGAPPPARYRHLPQSGLDVVLR